MKKQMDIDELFRCPENEMPEQLPMLSDAEKDRIYKASERKYNIEQYKNNKEDEDSVSGVEHYSRPVWKRRLASVAAAGVLLAGTGGLAYYIKNGTLDGFDTGSEVSTEVPETEDDYREIAEYLLDGYTDLITRMEFPESEQGTILKIYKSIYSDQLTELARYSDSDISCMEDLYKLGEKYMTSECLDDRNNFDFREPLEIGGINDFDCIQYSGTNSDENGMFFTRDGMLYTYYNEDFGKKDKGLFTWYYEDMALSEFDEDSFRMEATLGWKGKNPEYPVQVRYTYEVIRNEDSGEWLINSAEPVVVETKLDLQVDTYGMAMEYSERYYQLIEYIYSLAVRQTPEDSESITFTVQASEGDRENAFHKMTEYGEFNTNAFSNLHSVAEIQKYSYMEDDSLFSFAIGKVDDAAESGDTISFDGNNPHIIEYRGDLYVNMSWDALIDYVYMGPFSDEPEIVKQTESEIVFRRSAGWQSGIAEFNSNPNMYEFTVRKNDEGNWLISDVEMISSQSEPKDFADGKK